MKKVVGLLVIMIALSNSINAQVNGKSGNQNFTPEQIATLQTKRMNMLLNLSQEQQTAIVNLQKNQAMVRQAMRKSMLERKLKGKTLSSNELFQLQSSRLDRMQQHKIAMKKILTEEQFTKWENMKNRKHLASRRCNSRQTGQQKFKRQS